MRGSGCEAGVRGRCVMLCSPSPLTPCLPLSSLPASLSPLSGWPTLIRSLPHIHPAPLPAARPTPTPCTPSLAHQALATIHDAHGKPAQD